MNFGAAELVIACLAILPSLLAVALVIWLVVTVTAQGRHIAHLESRLHALERRGQTGA